MQCINCQGKGCEECGGDGRVDITACPLDIITADVWEVIRMAGFFEKGLPPVAGGVLDQAENFVAAAEFIFAEQKYYKNKLGIFN